MATTNSKPQSKLRIFLLWGALLMCILIGPVFLLWRASNKPAMEEAPGAVYSIVMLVLAVLALGAGAAGYLAAVYTQCLTFNFTKPVWHEVKVKKYFANIAFPTLVMLGIAFTSSAVFTPMASRLGLPGQMGFMVPFFAAFALSQCALIWVLVWAPLEKRVIEKRLAALGITAEQLRGGYYTGLSNPAVKSPGKRWYAIEEDMGMLWFTADQMIFWGDSEQFSLTRADLAQVERKVDTKSTTMLSGTAHVILHVRVAGGVERQIRLHNEGVWTMGGKKRASDELAARIDEWLGAGTSAASS